MKLLNYKIITNSPQYTLIDTVIDYDGTNIYPSLLVNNDKKDDYVITIYKEPPTCTEKETVKLPEKDRNEVAFILNAIYDSYVNGNEAEVSQINKMLNESKAGDSKDSPQNNDEDVYDINFLISQMLGISEEELDSQYKDYCAETDIKEEETILITKAEYESLVSECDANKKKYIKCITNINNLEKALKEAEDKLTARNEEPDTSKADSENELTVLNDKIKALRSENTRLKKCITQKESQYKSIKEYYGEKLSNLEDNLHKYSRENNTQKKILAAAGIMSVLGVVKILKK